MQRRIFTPLVIAASILVSVAIFGYLIGHSRSSAAPAAGVREASNAVASLDYPSTSGWRPAPAAPRIPGLSIAQPLVLAPEGDTSRAGLIAGQFVENGSLPLPRRFLVLVRQLPSAEVVDLQYIQTTQAYKYSQLSIGTSDRRFTVFTIPNSTPRKTGIVCYSSAVFASYMRTCEQIAASFTPTAAAGQAQNGDDLTPAVGYARQISAAVGRVDALRVALRPGITPGAAPVTVSRLAASLADGLAGVARSLAAMHPPAAAGWAHAALSEYVWHAHDAYSALATAAGAGSQLGYAAARAQVYEAEAGLNGALRDFVLLGYG